MKIFFLTAVAAMLLPGCFSSKKYDHDLTPEEFSRLDNAQRIEYLEARERAKRQPAPKKSRAEEGSLFDPANRNSVRKREKMNNINTPVLLGDDSSILPFKKDDEPRSKSLNRDQIERSTKY